MILVHFWVEMYQVTQDRQGTIGAVWVASHEHNLLPFSTPRSYALLSAESKATEAANNKERLVVCHFIVWCRTIFTRRRLRKVMTVVILQLYMIGRILLVSSSLI